MVDLCGLGRDNCLFNHCSCERIVRYIPGSSAAINAKEYKYVCFDFVDLSVLSRCDDVHPSHLFSQVNDR